MHKFFLSFLVVFLFIGSSQAFAGDVMIYNDGDVALEGYVATPDAEKFSGQRPAVLIIHQWKGLGDYEKMRADMLADLGYVAFAIDMYGQNVRPAGMKEAAAESSKYKDNPELARNRLNVALEKARMLPNVDPKRVVAIGYCFGGTMALELARSGADVNGVVSFHGGLATKEKAQKDVLKAAVQVHHGAADPLVPAKEVSAFEGEMDAAKADWQFISYADAVHAFTEKKAGNDPSKGVAYNEKADKRSWTYTLAFFDEMFK